MPESPLQAAGAQIEPSAAAPLHTNEWFTGMLTNGNPLGPGVVPYLYQKFYSANRYDRLVGGGNTEITMRSTLGRRFGHTAVNAAPGSAIKRMYLFNSFNTNGQNNRLLADITSTVDDITGTGDTPLFTKASGAGRACFQAVGNTCYIGDGVDLKKYMQAGKVWIASTVYGLGDIIIDTNGNVQVAEQFLTANILAVQILENAGSWYAVVTLDQGTPWGIATNIKFAGLQAYPGLNGLTEPVAFFANTNQVCVGPLSPTTPYGPTPDVGTATSNSALTRGKSGGTQPTWATGYAATTADGDIVWTNYGKPVYSWSPTPPSAPPVIQINGANRQWLPQLPFLNLSVSNFYWAILDSNNNVELLIVPPSGSAQTGPTVPIWSQQVPSSTSGPGQTVDNTATWNNCGPIGGWLSTFTFYKFQCIRDSNGNLQYVSAGGGGASGGAEPTWNATLGGTTADGALTWTNIGPATILLTDVRQYFYAYHTISGQVSTLSPAVTLNPDGNMLGLLGAPFAELTGPTPANTDIDQIWIFATPQGSSTPLLLSRIPSPGPGVGWSFEDNFPDSILSVTVLGPQNHVNDPPPAGFVPAAFHLGLVCGFVGNVLFYSNGATAVGNPNESFPPLNNFQLPSAPVAAWSTPLGLIILRVDGISVMLGSNTSTSPLYVVNIFDGVGLAARDAFATLGSSIFMVTTTGKVMRFTTSQFLAAIEGQDGVSQALPESEIGFPIGDLLAQFTPANCYVAWYEGPSNDSGLFVADGSTGWYMMRALTSPDQATPWSPKATLPVGLSCIYACETSPGVNSLLVGLPSGPVWRRDQSTNADAGTNFTATAIVSPVVLSQPGNTVTVTFVTTEEVKISGATPLTLGVLFNETSGTFRNLRNVTKDPPNLPPSNTIETQRFQLQQDAGTIPVCRYMLQEISWGSQDYPNEILTNTIYGRLPTRTHR